MNHPDPTEMIMNSLSFADSIVDFRVNRDPAPEGWRASATGASRVLSTFLFLNAARIDSMAKSELKTGVI